MLLDLLLSALLMCCFLLAAFLAASRVVRVNPTPNPKYRVPEISDFVYFKQILGWSFQNSKFEKTDPKFLDSPNTQAYWPA